MKHVSERCIAALKEKEGFTPVARQLAGDRPGVFTGGYGETQVKPGQVFTEEEADSRLRSRVFRDFEPIVNGNVRVPLCQSQFDALVLFVYNVGPGNFLTSTLLKKLNAGNYTGAAAEFPRWDKADGKVLTGLLHRRLFEQGWFVEAAEPEHAA